MQLDRSAPAAAPAAAAALAPTKRISTFADGRYVHILVPTSLARTERPALLWGAQTAAAHDARLSVLHVLPPFDESGSIHWLDGLDNLHRALSGSGGPPRRGTATPQDRRAAVEAWRHRVREFVEGLVPAALRQGVDLRAELSVGEVADEIARFADDEGVDLMILSSDLRRGWLPILPARLRQILKLTRTPSAVVRPDQLGPTVVPVV